MSTANDLSITIVGNSAMGRVWSGMLCQKGFDVTIIGREESIKPLRNGSNFTFSTPDKQCFNIAPTLRTYEEVQDEPSTASNILYAVKANYLSLATAQTKQLIGHDTNAIFVQGGLPWFFGQAADNDQLIELCDPEQQIAHCFPDTNRVFAGMISFGAGIDHDNPGHAILKSTKFPVIGAIDDNNPHLDDIKEILSSEHIAEPIIATNFKEAAMSKAIGSSAMHLTSLRLVAQGQKGTLGEMTNDPAILQWMMQYADTLRKAVKVLGIDIATDYHDYFTGIAEKLQNHVMSMVHDPCEFENVISRPFTVATSLGGDTEAFKPALQEGLDAANYIFESQEHPALSIEI